MNKEKNTYNWIQLVTSEGETVECRFISEEEANSYASVPRALLAQALEVLEELEWPEKDVYWHCGVCGGAAASNEGLQGNHQVGCRWVEVMSGLRGALGQ